MDVAGDGGGVAGQADDHRGAQAAEQAESRHRATVTEGLSRMKDFCCPLHHVAGASLLEWVQIDDHISRAPVGEVPRICMEALGLDVSPIDRGGTLWITGEQSARLHAHEHWRGV